MKVFVLISIIITGILSVFSQTALVREFLSIFKGNELCIGSILASWLIWVAVGAWISGHIFKKTDTVLLYINTQLIQAFILILSLYFVKTLKFFLNLSCGEVPGIIPSIILPFIIMFPLCFLFGMQFRIVSRLYYEHNRNDVAYSISRTYALEAAGWFIGGIIFNYLFVNFINNFYVAVISCGIFITAALIMSLLAGKKIHVALCLLLISGIAYSSISPLLKNSYYEIQKKQYSGEYQLIEAIDSKYGNVAVLKRKKQYSIYQNGILSFSSDNSLQNEEIVHFTLLRFPYAKNALLIGGGMSGVIDELLKYPGMENVWCTELDPNVVGLSKKYFKSGAFKDKRVKIINTDGRLFVKNLKGDRCFDCVIINLPDPINATINRFYTKEFFKEIKEILKPCGILTTGITSSDDYLSEELSDINGSIYRTLREVFEKVMIIPGERAYFLASQERYLPVTREFLSLNLSYLTSPTRYVNKQWLYYRLDPERMRYAVSRIKANNSVKINSDFFPVSYYNNLGLWVASYHIEAKKIFNWLQRNITEKNLIIVVAILAGIILLIEKLFHAGMKGIYIVLIMGFSGIAVELMLLMVFQSYYGYVYSQVSMLTASFMLGISAGSIHMNRKAPEKTTPWLRFIIASTILYVFLLPYLFKCFYLINEILIVNLTAHLIFPLLLLITGYYSGAIFTLSSRIILAGEKDQELKLTKAVKPYSLDLAGAAAGALFSGVIFIPVLGIKNLSILITVLLCFCMILSLIRNEKVQ